MSSSSLWTSARHLTRYGMRRSWKRWPSSICQTRSITGWLIFFSGHAHCTVYRDQTSTLKAINASIIQGSELGPAAYVVNGDLQAVTPINELIKFADDTYLVISASNVDTRSAEIDNIETRAQENNLTLNRTKTKRRRQVAEPPALPGIDQVTSLKILGVTMTDGVSASDHIRHIISDCAQSADSLCTTSLACPRHV